MNSLSNSGIREISSSQIINKSSTGNYQKSISSTGELKPPIMIYSNTSVEFKSLCLELAEKIVKHKLKDDKIQFKNMAEYLKLNIENKLDLKNSINVIVGASFGAFFDYEKNYLNMFTINNIHFLIWKFG